MLKKISSKFRVSRDVVEENNLLWLAPPITELEGKSLGAFDEWDPFRLKCTRLLTSKRMQCFFHAVNLINCILIAIKPVGSSGLYYYNEFGDFAPAPYVWIGNYYLWFEAFAAACLATEVFLAVIARGLLDGRYAFVRDPFNLLDAFVLCTTVVELSLLPTGWASNARALRLLRLLKPLLPLPAAAGARRLLLIAARAAPLHRALLLLLLILAYVAAVGLVPLLAGAYGRRCVPAGRATARMVEVYNDSGRVSLAVPERFCALAYNATGCAPAWGRGGD